MNLPLARTIAYFFFPGALGASHMFETYSRRRKLAGARVHPLAIFIYGVFGVAGVVAAIFLGYCAIINAAQEGFVDRGFHLLWALFLFGWTLSLVFDARKEHRIAPSSLSAADLESLRMEEITARLVRRTAEGGLVMLVMFGLTFFGPLACSGVWLGKDWEQSYAFMAGWIGWFTGLSLVFLKVTKTGSQSVSLKILVLILVAGMGVFGYFYPLTGVAALWVIGFVCGGASAVVSFNAQLQVLCEDRRWRCRLPALFRMPNAQDAERLKIQTRRGLLRAFAKASKSQADRGDVNAQFALWSFYYTGRGMPKDQAEACKWCLLAAAQGHPVAKSVRDRFANLATTEKIAEGERRAAQFVPKKDVASAEPPMAIK